MQINPTTHPEAFQRLLQELLWPHKAEGEGKRIETYKYIKDQETIHRLTRKSQREARRVLILAK